MAKITVEANQCDVCGHVWLPTGKPAVQCAKCRTRTWDRAVGMAAERFVKRLEDDAKLAGTNNVGIMGIKWTNPEDIPERTVEYEE